MPVPMSIVESFVDAPFTGNPAAVCVLPGPAPAAWMQKVAGEMNLSETSFVFRESNEVIDLRWFTPTVEVDLCGHATLAAAHALWDEGWLEYNEPARFKTRNGVLTCVRTEAGIEMDFPSLPWNPVTTPQGLIVGLGVKPIRVDSNGMDYLVEVGSIQEVVQATPDFLRLAQIRSRGIILHAKSDDQRYDFVSRFFAPAAGVNEDPVTGSAHCCLGPYWGERLDKRKLVGYQASRRGGIVKVELRGERVALIGRARTMLRGEWLIVE